MVGRCGSGKERGIPSDGFLPFSFLLISGCQPMDAAAHSVWVFSPELSLSGKALIQAQNYVSMLLVKMKTYRHGTH